MKVLLEYSRSCTKSASDMEYSGTIQRKKAFNFGRVHLAQIITDTCLNSVVCHAESVVLPFKKMIFV